MAFSRRALKFSLPSSFFLQRNICTVVRNQSGLQPIRLNQLSLVGNKVFVQKRGIGSSASNINFPTRTLVFFVLSSLGIVGGFYVISYSLTQSNIYKASFDLANRCPEVIELIGGSGARKGLAKGKMASGVADIHYTIQGPNGRAMVNVTGKLREGSKTEYDLVSISVQSRSTDEEQTISLYEEGAPVVEFLEATPAPATSTTSTTSTSSTTSTTPAQKQNGFLLDKPWYYRVGLAAACGAVFGVVLSVMIMSSRQGGSGSNSAYQSLLLLLKENALSKDILGSNIKSAGKLTGKSEESWANFSIRMQGDKSKATVNCQAFKQGDSWRFTVVSLDTPKGRVYLCK